MKNLITNLGKTILNRLPTGIWVVIYILKVRVLYMIKHRFYAISKQRGYVNKPTTSNSVSSNVVCIVLIILIIIILSQMSTNQDNEKKSLNAQKLWKYLLPDGLRVELEEMVECTIADLKDLKTDLGQQGVPKWKIQVISSINVCTVVGSVIWNMAKRNFEKMYRIADK